MTLDAAPWGPDRAQTADYAGRSNLALAFLCLPRAKRRDMNVFYTFCRLVDDIADSNEAPAAQKRALLDAWKAALDQPPAGQGLLVNDLHALIARYALPVEHLREIIAGVETDLTQREYATFEELRVYCHRVASVVGLVSIEIFGYRDPGCRQYALDLGLALQLTNIIRDVGADLDNEGRIYLPLEDLARFGYPVDALRRRVRDDRFRALMQFQAARAEGYYAAAVKALPPADRRSMVAAEIMRAVYRRLLHDIQRGGYDVFDRRPRLGRWTKLALMAGVALRSRTPALNKLDNRLV